MLGVWEGWSNSSPPLPDGKGVRRQVCVGGWLLTRIRCETRPFPSEEGGQLGQLQKVTSILKVTDDPDSQSQRYVSEDPNPYRNVTDPEH
jgi:hypothetical protein